MEMVSAYLAGGIQNISVQLGLTQLISCPLQWKCASCATTNTYTVLMLMIGTCCNLPCVVLVKLLVTVCVCVVVVSTHM